MSQISYHTPTVKAIEGQEHLPRPLGELMLANGVYPGGQAGDSLSLNDPREPGPDPREVGRGPVAATIGRFKAIRPTRNGARLEYDIAGNSVYAILESRLENGAPAVQLHYRVEKPSRQLWILLGRRPPGLVEKIKADFAADLPSDQPPACALLDQDGLLAVRVEPRNGPVEFRVAIASAPGARVWPADSDFQTQAPSAARWPEKLVTRGALSAKTGAFVVDDIPLPAENPWRRNIRLADIAFLRDGRAVAAGFDGDVWMISGLAGDLGEIAWKRFASGFHEPLGLCVRDEEIFVFDRNGIWRLRDSPVSGEAEVHELFSNVFPQTAETREFATGIRLAPDNSFVIGKGGIQATTLGKQNGTVLRVSADGQSFTRLAYGLREPFIGVNPVTGLVTASDQQGHYVPSTPLDIIRDGQFYGFLSSLLPREVYPASIAAPLTWIPYPVNASGAGQAWLAGAKMGPLNNALIHLGYYRPEIFLVLLNERSRRPQAAVLSVTRDLAFAPLNGAVNPVDGQLYITGFQIFGSDARQVSGLARLRYTGAPSPLPNEVIPMDKGVLLRFDFPVDPKLATDPASFSAERWSYRRTFNYGSPHFKQDGSKGQDPATPSSAYLSRDGRSVFVGIPGMKPVMQMRLGWALAFRDGAKLEQNAYFTPYELPRFDPAPEGFDSITVDLAPRQLSASPVPPVPATPQEGRRQAELLGCALCHSNDGSTLGKVGPTWKGLFGKARSFSDGTQAVADEAYIRESIRTPQAKIVQGYEKGDVAMPAFEGLVSDSQIEALILYIKTLQ
jgi:glucose/arabinose dehydrogenase/cytochrome c2